MDKRKAGLIIFVVCLLALIGVCWNAYYIWHVSQISNPNYIESEIQRINDEKLKEEQLTEQIRNNPDTVDANKLTDSQKEEYLSSLINNQQRQGEILVNDFMKELSVEAKTEKLKMIENSLKYGDVSSAVNQATNIKDAYNLNDDSDYLNKIVNVALMSFLKNNSEDIDYSEFLYAFSNPRYLTYAFIYSNQKTQTNAIKYKESEVLPINFIEVVVDEGIEVSLYGEMNASSFYPYSKNYEAYRFTATFDGTEYFIYVTKEKSTGLYEIFKTTLKENVSSLISDNSYKGLSILYSE